MAHSRAPHPLAEAIADLAAPPVAETYLIIHPGVRNEYGYPVLLLHLRPRRVAAGLEASVRCCRSLVIDEDWCCELWQSGPVFAVSSLPLACGAQQRDIDSFAAELLEAGWHFSDGINVQLHLPERACEYSTTGTAEHLPWQRIHLQLMPAAAFEAVAAPVDRVRLHLRGAEPNSAAPVVVSQSCVQGCSIPYARHQAEARQERQERSMLQEAAEGGDAEAVAALASLPPPATDYDDDASMQAHYAELRADDMRRLAAAISNLIKLACRFRGMASHPAGAAPSDEEDGAAGTDSD